uniref:Testis expressed 10 n=1 Tax=Cyprinus carpio TaxID=7962 RepID=A0A8C1XXU3_CYPCA
IKLILTILQLLRRPTPHRDQQDILDNFPYGLLEVARHKKKPDGKRIRQQVAAGTVAGGNVEPLALNVTLCQDHIEAEDADWLGPIRVFIRETLSNGGKLEVVWRMIVTQRSRVVTDDLLQAVYVQYQQWNLAVSVRSLLLRIFSQLYIQEHQNHPHIARYVPTTHFLSDPQEGCHCVVVLPVESQKRLVQILRFLPAFPAELLACLSQVCNTARVSASLATMLIRTIHLRSPLSGWLSSSQDVPVKDVDYLSFFFTTLKGFSSEMLQALQDTDEDGLLPSSSLSPLSVFATNLEQFLHHWDIVEEVCHYVDTLGSRAQCFDVIQNAIIKNLCGLVVVPDCVCAAILRCVPRLLDVNFLPSDTLLHFLSDFCLRMLNLLLQLEQSARKRCAHKHAHPHTHKYLHRSFCTCDLCEKELHVLAQILSLLLQHTQLRNHMMANASLLQHIIQDLTHYYGGETREQWLTDLLYCYSVTLSGHRANIGMRDIY